MKLRSLLICCLILTSISSVACRSNARRGSEDPVPRLIGYLKSEDATTRRWALFGLGRLGDWRGYKPALELLNDENERTREQAIRTAAQIGGRKAIDAVLRASDCNSSKYVEFDVDRLTLDIDSLPDDPLTCIMEEHLPPRSAITEVLVGLGDVRVVEPLLADAWCPRETGRVIAKLGVKAVDQIMAGLMASQPGTRVAAAEALGRIRYQPAIPQLKKLFDDQSADVREAAAAAVSAMRDPSGIAELRGLLANKQMNSMIRALAACDLGRFGGRSVGPDLVAALQETDETVRVGAACGLGILGDPANVGPLDEAISRTGVWSERVNTAGMYALRRLVRRIGLKSLLSRYSESRSRVASCVRDEVSYRRATKDVEAQINNPDPAIREGARQACISKDFSNDERWIKWVRSDIPDMRRRAAERMNGVVPGPYRELLAAMLNDPDESVRQAAISSLAGSRDNRAVPYLVKRLESRVEVDRLRAFYELSRMPIKLVSDILAAHLVDANSQIRMRSLELLVQVKDQRAHKHLLGMLDSIDPSERCQAARTLAQLGDRSGTNELLPYLGSSNQQEKLDAAVALSATGDKRALTALLELSRDPNWSGSDKLISALAKYDDPRVTKALLAALKCDYTPTVDVAARVLGKKRVAEAFGPIAQATRAGCISTDLAFSSLCEIDPKKAIGVIANIVGDSNANVYQRVDLIHLLLPEVKQRCVLNALMAAATNPDPELEMQMVWQLEDINDPRSENAVLRLMCNEDSSARWDAAWILSKLRTPGARSAIMQRVMNWDMDVLAGAIEYVIGIGDDRMIPQIEALFAAHPDQADRFVGPLIHSREPRLVRAVKAYCATHPGTSMDEEPTNWGAALYRWGELKH